MLTKISFCVLSALSSMVAADINVGVLAPFSKNFDYLGRDMYDGVRTAAYAINKNGGINGEKINLIPLDDQGIASKGIELSNQLFKKNVSAVLGISNIGEAKLLAPIYQKAQVPLIINLENADNIVDRLSGDAPNPVFRVALKNADMAEVLIHKLVDVDKHKKIAIIVDNTIFGLQGRDAMVKALAKRKVEPVYSTSYKANLNDFDNLIPKARESNADALIVYGVGVDLSAARLAINRYGWAPKIVGAWTLASQNYISLVGSFSENTMMPISTVYSEGYFYDIRQLYRYVTQNQLLPNSYASFAQGYDSMLLLGQALKEAPSKKGADVIQSLETMKTPVHGLIKTYNQPFSKGREALDSSDGVLAIIKDSSVIKTK